MVLTYGESNLTDGRFPLSKVYHDAYPYGDGTQSRPLRVLSSIPSQTGNSGKYLTTNGTSLSWDAINISTADITGTVPVTNGGTGFATAAQGDLIYGSAANTFSKLSKDTNATRYLSNTGTSNDPAWAQIDLTNGVTNDLPFSNLAQGSARSVLGVTGNSTADVASIQDDGDEFGGCWGFYGYDNEKSGLMEHARDEVDCYLKEKADKEMQEQNRKEKLASFINPFMNGTVWVIRDRDGELLGSCTEEVLAKEMEKDLIS